MENKLKLTVSRMFRSSFSSCRSKHNPSDVIDQPFFFPSNRQHCQLIDLFSPKPPPFPSICRPKWRQMVEEEKEDVYVRHKVSDRNSVVSADTDARKCSDEAASFKSNRKDKRSKKSNRRKKRSNSFEFKSSIEANYYSLYSSDDDGEYDDDETTLFSSKSMSSDSSGSFRRTTRRRAKSGKGKGRGVVKKQSEANLMPLEVKVGDSFAVVKRSSDPYNDFRTSMVEMIIERQIFGGKDLEDLLQCFLSLNSECHHRVIVEVFTEIWETLFSDWC